jgi:hypothetical protein
VSATAIHTWVQQQGRRVTFAAQQAEGRPLLLDDTKVKAGRKERGAPLHLGMALVGRSLNGGRPKLEKQVVAFTVDENWAASLAPLADVTPERVIFDGEQGLAEALTSLWPRTSRQRCLWHLPNQIYYALWADELRMAEIEPLQDRLRDLLYASPTLESGRAAYQALLDELRLEGLERGASYLQNAQAHAFTFRRHPEGLFTERPWVEGCQAPLATSPLEREMREINRRTDNGSRWSVPGVRNLVGLDLLRRYHRQQWEELWQLPMTVNTFYFVLKVQVGMVAPHSNVSTT